MNKFKKIAEWTVIVLFLVIVVSVASIFIYRAVIGSDWYIEGQTEDGYNQMVKMVNNYENIDCIKVDIDTEEFIFDAPKELFDDISCKSFKPITDSEELVRLFKDGDFVTVFYRDGSYHSFSVIDGEVYWGGSLKVECPSLLAWLYN